MVNDSTDQTRRGDQTSSPTDGEPSDSETAVLVRPTTEHASGFGLSMTLLTGVLLAFGYYGIVSVSEGGFGQAIPESLYLLALALVFVIELSRSRALDARGLARAVGTTAVYGTLVIFAVEGGAYLWENPGAALDDFAGAAVLAVALVTAAVAYIVYLSAVEAANRPS